MGLDNIDWNIVVMRGVVILGVWLVVWLARHFLVRWVKTTDRYVDLIEFDEKDIDILKRIVDVALFIVGLGATLSILNLASLFLASTIVWRVIALALVWVVVWILVRYLSCWIQTLDSQIEEIDIDPRDLKTMDRLLDYLIIIVGIIISLAILNVTSLLYSALTAVGIVSVMIGFAV